MNYSTMNYKMVNSHFRHKFHVMAPAGWINDPNGFCFFDGEYHLFYQHYPYDSEWGKMHWGHCTTVDFVRWKHLPIALKPDSDYDKDGVYSGSAIEKDSRLYLFYTGHTQNDGKIRQVQCVAVSDDGINFKKPAFNPLVVEKHLPIGATTEDFRDPKIWFNNGRYVMLVGSKTLNNMGQFLFFVSQNLEQWDYANSLTSCRDLGDMWECPDYFQLQGQEILMFSPQNMMDAENQIGNTHKAVFMNVILDRNTLTALPGNIQIIDYGFDFYAPQTVKTLDGRQVMIAWMNMWERTYIPHVLGHNWSGSMTIPRELSIKENQICQLPIKELQGYRQNRESFCKVSVLPGKPFTMQAGQCSDIELALQSPYGVYISLFNGDLTLNVEKDYLELRRNSAKYPIHSKGKEKDNIRRVMYKYADEMKIRIITDISSVEIFVDDGRISLSSLIFSEFENILKISTADSSYITTLEKWDILI